MSAENPWIVCDSDRARLRELGQRLMAIAHSHKNAERRQAWLQHNDLKDARPLILTETSGLLQSGELNFDSEMQCREPWARKLEQQLLDELYRLEYVCDDTVAEPWLNVNWQVNASDFGVEVRHHHVENSGTMGSFAFEPPLRNLGEDLEKLHTRTFHVDRETTHRWKQHLDDVFDGVMPVRIRGGFWWSAGLTVVGVHLIGLENLMLYMHDDPGGLHRFMAFLRDDQLTFADWLETEGLLTLNNENDYVGSGSIGYTQDMPRTDWKPGSPVQLRDLWVLSESQETVGVSPAMFEEFIFPYQRPIIERFGLCYYGCCEPLHARWDVIRRLPNLRKVSVSPWCNEQAMSEAIGRSYVYCRKPNPSLVSTRRFDEDSIRRDLKQTLQIAGNCPLEIVMKDVHTLAGEPWRLRRWVELARECCS